MRLFRDRFLTIDIRTRGLARIYVALLLLFDLARRSLDMSIWYVEDGLLPNAMLAEHPLGPWAYSFLYYVSSDTGVRLAFALIALVYLALLIGAFTRVAQVLAALEHVPTATRTAAGVHSIGGRVGSDTGFRGATTDARCGSGRPR